ncbi:MAG: flippase [Elusimicrobia bacterium]|nr:flippase [Candidatus Obscuribacterium magneticum]
MFKPYRPAFIKDISIHFTTQIFVFLISLFTSTLVARSIGPAGTGLYALAVLLPTVVYTLFQFGFGSAIVYHLNRKTHSEGALLSSALLYSNGFGLLLALALIPFCPLLSQTIFRGVSSNVLASMGFLIPVFMSLDILVAVLLARRDMRTMSVVLLIRPGLYAACLAAFYLTPLLTVNKVMTAFSVGLVGSYVLAFAIICVRRTTDPLWPNRSALASLFHFGIRQHIGSVAQFLNYRVDTLILAAFLDPTAVGLYSLSVMIAEILWYLPGSVGQILYSKTAASKTETANTLTPVVVRYTMGLAIFAAIGIGLTAEYFIPWWFTPKFLESSAVIRWLLPGTLALCLSKIIGSDLSGRGFPQYGTYSSIISLILNVVLNIILIPRFGIRGAAAASSISYIVNALVLFFLFRMQTGISGKTLLIPRKSDVALIKEHLKSAFSNDKKPPTPNEAG